MKTKFRKLLVITVALVMVFAMSATAFADINYTVIFTAEGVGNTTYNPWDSVSAHVSENISDKNYFVKDGIDYENDSNVNPLGTRASVMDALLDAMRIRNLSSVKGLDLTPMYGNPGAYISDVEYLTKINQYNQWQDENGQWWGNSVGYGWQAYITPVGGGEESATSYLSSIELHEGDTIRFDYRSYDYTWQIPAPRQLR